MEEIESANSLGDRKFRTALRDQARVIELFSEKGVPFFDPERKSAFFSTPVLDLTKKLESFLGDQSIPKRMFLKEEYRNPLTNSVKGRAVAAMVLGAIRSEVLYKDSGVRKKWIEPTSGNTGKGLAEVAQLLGVEFTAVFSRLDISEDIKNDLSLHGAKSITIGSEYSITDLEELARRHGKSVHYYWTTPGRMSDESEKLVIEKISKARNAGKEPEHFLPIAINQMEPTFFIDKILPPAAEALRSPLTAKIERGELDDFKAEALKEIPDLGRFEVIVAFICPRGNTSMALNTLFSQLGFSNVCSIKGGVEALRAEDGIAESSEYCPLPGSSISTSSIDFVKKLVEENPEQYFTFNQYENEDNVNAHILTTGPELQSQIPDLGAIVCTFGTGGTATGLARFFNGKGVRVYASFPKKPVEGIRTLRGAEGLRFYKPEEYEGILEVDNEKASALLKFFVESGVEFGPSTAIAFEAAIMLLKDGRDSGKAMAVIAADSMENYRTEYSDLLKLN